MAKIFGFASMILIFLGMIVVQVSCHSNSYYDIINVMMEGKDLYETLNLTPQATHKEIKKAFRTLSLTLHPDKAKNKEEEELNAKKYFEVQFASEVLTDEEKKREYDNMRINGIPTADRYYSRYAYAYGAPNVDIKYIIVGLVALISGCQWMYQSHRHHKIHRLARETQRYKEVLKRGEEPQLLILGAEKPELKNLFVIQMIFLPWTLGKAFYSIFRVVFKLETEEERDEALRIRMGFEDKEEWEDYKKKEQSRMDSRKNSTKMKQYRRWLKKQ
eukprot:TRINITY_DN4953_c0_g1_i1.p1 TRINITY_DN4953_c0_g1~~TRINITY_DN4953_c0_g1_i1.p1  ORF type:complete len:298 (-),score=88.09 TRINITY_DN4953_c0_g1_i1:6-827(-)